MRSPSRRITIIAAFVATGLVLGYIETFIVLPVNIPGFRIGIANIAGLLALYLLGPVSGLCVVLVRVMVSAILFGSGVSFVYSLCGAIFSFGVMALLYAKSGLSPYGISVAGAVVHNLAQLAAAVFLVGSVYVTGYAPVLIIVGVLSGLLTGFVSDILYKRLKRLDIFDNKEPFGGEI